MMPWARTCPSRRVTAAFVEEVMVVVVAACAFLARFEEALVVLAKAVRQRRFLAGDECDASAAAAMGAGQFKRHFIFLDFGAVQMLDWHALACGQGFAFLAQDVRQFLAVFAEDLALDALLV